MPAHRQEEIKVGIVVVVSVLVFLTALVFVGGVNLFGKKKVSYVTYFKFAGGMEPGSVVRFGGLKVGTVQSAEIDPDNSTRIRIHLLVLDSTPIRTDSKARISTLGFLGENYVEISPGTRAAPRLPAGSEIPALEIVQLAEVFNNVNNVTLNASKLVGDLDDKVLVLANKANELINNLNAVVAPENRKHFEAVLANTDAMLAESRPRIQKTLGNLQEASAKLDPVIDHADVTVARLNTLTGNLNGTVMENRAELHEALLRLRESLVAVRGLIATLDATLEENRANLHETLDNLRVSSENLKEFTDTAKRRPFSLIRIKAEKDRVPPQGKASGTAK